MPGFNPDKLNIKDLTVEEPEKQPMSFDVEKDVAKEEWKAFDDMLKDAWNKNDYRRVFDIVGNLKILGHVPAEVPKYKWNIAEDHLMRDAFVYGGVLEVARIKKAKPEASLHLKENKILESFDEVKRHGNIESLIEISAAMKIAGMDVNLSEDQQKFIKEVGGNEKWATMANVRILFPDFRPSSSQWNFMRSQMNEMRETIKNLEEEEGITDPFRINNLLELFSCMEILSADEVKVPKGGGLELTHRQKPILKSEALQMPEQRNF